MNFSASLDPETKSRLLRRTENPLRVLFFIACFICFCTMYHIITLMQRFWPFRASRTHGRTLSAQKYHCRRIPVALLNAFRSVAFRCTLTIGSYYTLNTAEIFLSVAYVTLLFIWTFVNSKNVANRYDPSYWANISGDIAASQVPLLTALGTKNNIIGVLTGVSHIKLNILHRICARVVTIFVWIHVSGKLKLGVTISKISGLPTRECGVLAVTSLSLLIIVSFKPLRKRFYELFIILHLVLALIFVLAAHFHTQSTPFPNYIWPAIVIWGVDRLVRLARVSTFYFHRQPATVIAVSPVSMIIRVPCSSFFRGLPGQMAFLSAVPSISNFKKLGLFGFESHPFTIASIYTHEFSSSSDEADDEKFSSTEIEKGVEFMVVAREGFTKRLMDATLASDGNLNLHLVLDGGYGEIPYLKNKTVVLIAGGSGISFTVPLLLRTIKLIKSGHARVIFVWAVRDYQFRSYIVKCHLKPILQEMRNTYTCNSKVSIYDTSRSDLYSIPNVDAESKTSGPVDTVHARSALSTPSPDISQDLFEVVSGRPHIKDIVDRELENQVVDAPFNEVSVFVCGPKEMQEDVLSAVNGPRRVKDILRGGPSVKIYTESYGAA